MFLAACALSLLAGGKFRQEAVRFGILGERGAYTGFSVGSSRGKVADVLLSSNGLITATQVQSGANGLKFDHLGSSVPGLTFSADSSISVTRAAGKDYPQVAFDLSVTHFDGAVWEEKAGKAPFHFLCIEIPTATVWHQHGWLNATPLSDPFPLLLDPHAGTPEISAYKFNRNWGNSIPIGAQPVPVIGIWDSSKGLYAGLDFGTTRLTDNSEKDIASAYFWGGEEKDSGGKRAEQFACLTYPYGGQGYQSLVMPPKSFHLRSSARLLWSDHLSDQDDPNELAFQALWRESNDQLPKVPSRVDMSWLPGGIRQSEFPTSSGGSLISTQEKPFDTPDTRLVSAWEWRYENPVEVAVKTHNAPLMAEMERCAKELVPVVQRKTVGADECDYWIKPFQGRWTEAYGGEPVATLHNANGFAAGRMFLALGVLDKNPEYLKIARGVFNWAKHIVWTRNEFADVPSSPFAIGGTLPNAFCWEYAKYLDSKGELREAEEARRLARTFTYRYLAMWASDSNRNDNLDSSFLWEPNSGRDWTGAACANEVFYSLDSLAMNAVETGDPILMWATQGSLSRFHALYQNVKRPSLADYRASDLAEGYGLYAGNVYGVGVRSAYGFSSSLRMIEPVGSSNLRVLVGKRAALAFDKNGSDVGISEYRRGSDRSYSFLINSFELKPLLFQNRHGGEEPREESEAPKQFDVTVTEPYSDNSSSILILRNGKVIKPIVERPSAAFWSVLIHGVHDEDRVLVGESKVSGPVLPSNAAPAGEVMTSGRGELTLPFDTSVKADWSDPNSFAGWIGGERWAYGTPYSFSTSLQTVRNVFDLSVKGTSVFLAASGRTPEIQCEDGSRIRASADGPVLVWRAWPPLFKQRVLGFRFDISGKKVARIDPKGAMVWAATVDTGNASVWKKGAVEFAKALGEETKNKALGANAQSVKDEAIAILPPDGPGTVLRVLGEADLDSKFHQLTPMEYVSGAVIKSRFPVALYSNGEDYLDTVRTPGDGSAAIKGFLDSGGLLVLATAGPFPMFYATGDGSRPDPLPPKLGLPIVIPFPSLPKQALSVVIPDDAPAEFKNLPSRYPLPVNDARVRTIDASQLPAEAVYIPIAKVMGANGKYYGDAAGYVQFKNGGRILYVWGGLTNDPELGQDFARSILRFALDGAKG